MKNRYTIKYETPPAVDAARPYLSVVEVTDNTRGYQHNVAIGMYKKQSRAEKHARTVAVSLAQMLLEMTGEVVRVRRGDKCQLIHSPEACWAMLYQDRLATATLSDVDRETLANACHDFDPTGHTESEMREQLSAMLLELEATGELNITRPQKKETPIAKI